MTRESGPGRLPHPAEPEPRSVLRRPAPERRCYRLAWPPWQPPGVDGLAAIVAPGASTAWADGLLARDADGLVVWAATAGEPEPHGLARLGHPGVRAITFAPAKVDPRRVRLGLELAMHLAASRDRTGGDGDGDGDGDTACLTSWSMPVPPAGVVRIPHLISIQRDGMIIDRVVWELAPVATAERWLGAPLPQLAYFEPHLDTLLRLRGAARRAQLPVTAVQLGLGELLRDRDLSIKLVYEHAATFRALLASWR